MSTPTLTAIKTALEQKKQEQMAIAEKAVAEKLANQISGKKKQ